MCSHLRASSRLSQTNSAAAISVRLTTEESERTERLARVIATAEFVWDNREEARDWLHTPHPELENRSPLASAMTELGARRVENLLDGIFYGLPA